MKKDVNEASVQSVVMQRAWLHRRRKSTWMFEPSQVYGELVHVTRSGTVYAIMAGHKCGKPFWVARLKDDGKGSRSWVTVEAELRARSIEFEDAGEYVFPSA
jgi:hypothetical protein